MRRHRVGFAGRLRLPLATRRLPIRSSAKRLFGTRENAREHYRYFLLNPMRTLQCRVSYGSVWHTAYSRTWHVASSCHVWKHMAASTLPFFCKKLTTNDFYFSGKKAALLGGIITFETYDDERLFLRATCGL